MIQQAQIAGTITRHNNYIENHSGKLQLSLANDN